MRICIIGGGKVGFYLAKSLLEHGHTPIVIEWRKRDCEKLADTLDIPAICGDGTTLEALEAANCADCAALVAASGDDQTNLIACQLAKKVFKVPKTVARVNNPKNTEVLRQLGVDIPVSSTDNLGRLLEREVETSAIRQLLSMAGGTASLTEITIPASFPHAGRVLAELHMPQDAIIISVTRGEEFIIPRGSTALLVGDKVLCLAKDTAFHALAEEWQLSR